MYRHQQDANTGGEQHFHLSASSNSSFNFSPFSATQANAMIAPCYQNSPQHLSPPLPSSAIQPASHRRHASNEWHDRQRQPTSSLSPRIRQVTPSRNGAKSFTPTDRTLPSKEVTGETIADAYVQFILYCNPNFSLSIETSTLRQNFQTPPKSDNKDFETYRLFELITKFDAKEIKTWGQLALDLGVEAPDTSKGQSVQKVQQYSVRLKRWMRAMHVDAFFDYLLGKQHDYFNKIPHPSDPYPSHGRDGVPAEEDLAIRALDPSFRPKRGRRRNSEAQQDDENDNGPASKQPRLADETQHGIPASAHPSAKASFNSDPDQSNDPWAVASAVTPQSFAPWASKPGGAPHSAVATTAPSHLRWQIHGNSQNPATPHPMSAMPASMATHIDAAFDNEPKSAITPSTRKRRKHGPAVSSAWPSANPPGAKPRGRPPAGRNVQDGPYSTFPADPTGSKSNVSTSVAPVASMEVRPSSEEQQISQMHAEQPMAMAQGESLARPGRLSLQVPQHTGAPVRLATPPRVLVNGEANDRERTSSRTPVVEFDQHEYGPPTNSQQTRPRTEREVPGFAFEALKRVLASDLLRADLTGRRQRLTGDEAKRLADAALERLNVPRLDTENSRDDIARVTAASWLGVGDQLNVPLGAAAGQTKRITVTRFRIDAEGYEEIVSAYDESSPAYSREVFDISWNASIGGCNGMFEMKGLSLHEPEPEPDNIHDVLLATWLETAHRVGVDRDHIDRVTRTIKQTSHDGGGQGVVGVDAVDWESKYRALEFGAKMGKGEFYRYRQRVIEQLLDVLL